MKTATALLPSLAAARLAHDVWIEPTNFRPQVGETVGLALKVGQNFRGHLVPRMSEPIENSSPSRVPARSRSKACPDGTPRESRAIRGEDPEKRLPVRTNPAGRAAFDLAPAGVRLVKAVQMVPAPPSSGAHWESPWTPPTFELP